MQIGLKGFEILSKGSVLTKHAKVHQYRLYQTLTCALKEASTDHYDTTTPTSKYVHDRIDEARPMGPHMRSEI